MEEEQEQHTQETRQHPETHKNRKGFDQIQPRGHMGSLIIEAMEKRNLTLRAMYHTFHVHPDRFKGMLRGERRMYFPVDQMREMAVYLGIDPVKMNEAFVLDQQHSKHHEFYSELLTLFHWWRSIKLSRGRTKRSIRLPAMNRELVKREKELTELAEMMYIYDIYQHIPEGERTTFFNVIEGFVRQGERAATIENHDIHEEKSAVQGVPGERKSGPLLLGPGRASRVLGMVQGT